MAYAERDKGREQTASKAKRMMDGEAGVKEMDRRGDVSTSASHMGTKKEDPQNVTTRPVGMEAKKRMDRPARKKGGRVHEDAAEDKKLIAKEMKTHDEKIAKDDPKGEYAKGGRVKSGGKTTVNIVIGAKDQPDAGMAPGAGMPPGGMPPGGPPAPPPRPPMMPPAGGPPGMPPGAGGPPMPPSPMMGRKKGGRVPDMPNLTGGAGSGIGRLEKNRAAE